MAKIINAYVSLLCSGIYEILYAARILCGLIVTRGYSKSLSGF